MVPKDGYKLSCHKTVQCPTFYQISSFVFSRTKKCIQVWNNLKVIKQWQHFLWTTPLSVKYCNPNTDFIYKNDVSCTQFHFIPLLIWKHNFITINAAWDITIETYTIETYVSPVCIPWIPNLMIWQWVGEWSYARQRNAKACDLGLTLLWYSKYFLND